jgi:hypothetical protein
LQVRVLPGSPKSRQKRTFCFLRLPFPKSNQSPIELAKATVKPR